MMNNTNNYILWKSMLAFTNGLTMTETYEMTLIITNAVHLGQLWHKPWSKKCVKHCVWGSPSPVHAENTENWPIQFPGWSISTINSP